MSKAEISNLAVFASGGIFTKFRRRIKVWVATPPQSLAISDCHGRAEAFAIPMACGQCPRCGPAGRGNWRVRFVVLSAWGWDQVLMKMKADTVPPVPAPDATVEGGGDRPPKIPEPAPTTPLTPGRKGNDNVGENAPPAPGSGSGSLSGLLDQLNAIPSLLSPSTAIGTPLR